jgi:vacuolar-type H+-ATPase catalytic subunit A/Vma1
MNTDYKTYHERVAEFVRKHHEDIRKERADKIVDIMQNKKFEEVKEYGKLANYETKLYDLYNKIRDMYLLNEGFLDNEEFLEESLARGLKKPINYVISKIYE